MDYQKLHQLFLNSSGVCTDTRKVVENSIFFALKGANFDGNKFCKQALNQGAKLCVVDVEALKNDPNCFYVEDVLESLQGLATFHRNYLNTPLIALTGSNGKTTTKELIATVLNTKKKVLFTDGNFNNHIGVPLTLLRLNESHDIGVIEMGANHQKEIAFLAQIAQPNFGLIANIGSAHLEGFGGKEGVRKGKTELYDYLVKNKCIIFFNELEESLKPSLPNYDNVIFYGNNKPKLIKTESDVDGKLVLEIELDNKIYTIKSNLFGAYNSQNIITAIAIGSYFNIPPKTIVTAIESYEPNNNRSQLSITEKDNKLVKDSYNANPNSMLNALIEFKTLTTKDKIFVIGDMFELGEETKTEHLKIVNYIKQNHLSGYFVGKHFCEVLTDDFIGFENVNLAKEFFEANPVIGKTILLKGSRGIGLEKLESDF